jgi:hypothetical protein
VRVRSLDSFSLVSDWCIRSFSSLDPSIFFLIGVYCFSFVHHISYFLMGPLHLCLVVELSCLMTVLPWDWACLVWVSRHAIVLSSDCLLSCLVVVLSCDCLVLSCPVLSRRVVPCSAVSCFVVSCHALSVSCRVVSCLVSFCLVLPCD